MPPLRLAIIDDLATNPDSTATDVRKRLNKPWTPIDRQLKALHMLGILDMEEHEEMGVGTKITTRFYYSLADGIDPSTLTSPDLAEGGVLRDSKEVALLLSF